MFATFGCWLCALAVPALAYGEGAPTDVPASVETRPAATPDSTSPEAEPAATQPASAPAPFFDVLHNDRLTGDWGGLRPDLEQHGLSLESQLTTIYRHAAHGGLNTRNAHDVYGRADQLPTLDLEQAGLWRGGELFTWVESGWNEGVDEHVGSLMGTTAASLCDEEVRVRELWYEQRFLDDKARFKLGKYGIAVDIDTNAFANHEITQFMQPALVNTGNIPIPDFGLGAVSGLNPTEWMYFNLAATDAQVDGRETGLNTAFHDEAHFFSAAELGFTSMCWPSAWPRASSATSSTPWRPATARRPTSSPPKPAPGRSRGGRASSPFHTPWAALPDARIRTPAGDRHALVMRVRVE